MMQPFSAVAYGPILRGARSQGNSPTLLLLHGVVRCWQDFGPVLPGLLSRWQVIAVDHRGHGASDRADRYHVADYVADTVALAESLEREIVIVGHSLGALVALGTAALAPHRVKAVILEDPPSADFLARLDQGPYRTQFAAYHELCGIPCGVAEKAARLAEVRLPDGGRLGDKRDAVAIRFLARCLTSLDRAVLLPLLEGRWLDGFDPLSAARKLQCPALLLCADPAQGGMLPREDASALTSELHDCTNVSLPGIGHLIHGSQPELYTRLVMNFLDSLDSPRRDE